MKFRQFFLAIGPLFTSVLIIMGIFLFNISPHMSEEEIAYQATARNYSTLKGEFARGKILSDDKYIPFYSSSEMAIFDEFHPSLLAEKYNRSYRPYIAGRDAQGALTHYLQVSTMGKQHKGKKVVYLMSPNSFMSPKGISDKPYESVHSSLSISHWLLDIKKVDEADKYAAKRLLSYKIVQDDNLLAPCVQKIKNGEKLSIFNRMRLGANYRWLRSEDALFSQVDNSSSDAGNIEEMNELSGLYNFRYAKKNKLPNLPDEYNLEMLDSLAYNIGKATSTNNTFGFFDLKYEKDIGNKLKDFENSRTNITYTNSLEFSDFQLLLNEFALLDIEPYFIFMPIEEKWANFTGQSKEEREGVVKKIDYQLKSQGFNNFLVVNGTKKYTHVDGAHAGRQSWVEVDSVLNEFLTSSKKASLDYKINDFFYSEEWSKKKLEEIKDIN